MSTFEFQVSGETLTALQHKAARHLEQLIGGAAVRHLSWSVQDVQISMREVPGAPTSRRGMAIGELIIELDKESLVLGVTR